jgi:translation elongation factor P/translation initiation factor 5A
MKKKAQELKVGNKIILGGETLEIIETESSDMGKQGQKKCRLVAKRPNGENIVLIRPSDYPFEVK